MSRSFLFVPADSERKLEKAGTSGADALILDLEDSVAASARSKARNLAAEFLKQESNSKIWVRINPLDSADALEDLQAVMPAAPEGIVLPKPRGASDAKQLAKLLDALEQESELEAGRTLILPVATERPAALFGMDEYAESTARLAGLTWGAEDLSTAVGASSNRDESGNWLPPYQLARSLCLFAAAAAGVPAVDTVYTDFKDVDGLAGFAAAARRDGFEGMLAIHPEQVAIINKAFVPTPAETERAQRIIALFAANPEVGALGMDGEMIDRPHWLQAKRILETARRLK
ncbi:HpcH/HpaI aldolase/citrate lyase family [uncultured Woeseiaceae bacterium]|uniref:HpcH/HpaI aldolase/citrate lyase family n=1 Tax=uncultured Woeseiaceae bacterium TaxID=1983305 RepID=A0A7D9D1V1_9GAMM|nr:HpcH/HpaI aldolase/citrate lyase family [uncultured Woeseiaceae bacterium]